MPLVEVRQLAIAYGDAPAVWAVGMARQGFDLQLTGYDERGWRATVRTASAERGRPAC
jgi:hypothetical protein